MPVTLLSSLVHNEMLIDTEACFTDRKIAAPEVIPGPEGYPGRL